MIRDHTAHTQNAVVARQDRARSALAQVLTTVFGGHWVGQQGFTTTAEIDMLHDALQVGPDAHVLDIDCGTGGPALHLARQTGCHVLGIDTAAEHVRHAQDTAWAAGLADQVHFVTGHISSIELVAQSFDAIVCRDALVTTSNKANLFARCRWLLRPGGRMACTMIVNQGELIAMPYNVDLLCWPVPTIHEYRAFALLTGFQILAIEDLTMSMRDVGARWRGALAVWEAELRAELSQDDYNVLQMTIGRLAEWATRGEIGHMCMILLRGVS